MRYLPRSALLLPAAAVLVHAASPLMLSTSHVGSTFFNGAHSSPYMLDPLSTLCTFRVVRQCVRDRPDPMGQHPVRPPSQCHLRSHLTSSLSRSYVNASVANATGLLAINSAGNAILKLDNSTSDPNPGPHSTFGRNSVLIETNYTIDIGTLVVLDAVHIPYGVRTAAAAPPPRADADMWLAVQRLAGVLDLGLRHGHGCRWRD
jgi:hypothetical protein